MSTTTYSNDSLPESLLPSERITEFCRYLRENGMQTTTRDVELLTEVLVLAGGACLQNESSHSGVLSSVDRSKSGAPGRSSFNYSGSLTRPRVR